MSYRGPRAASVESGALRPWPVLAAAPPAWPAERVLL